MSDDASLFLAYCKSGSTGDIVEMVQKNKDIIKSVDELGNTSLHYAAGAGNCETISLLLKYGISVNSMNKRRETALFKAALRGRFEAVKLLMGAGADPELKNADGKKPIDVASTEECRAELQPVVDIPIIDDEDDYEEDE